MCAFLDRVNVFSIGCERLFDFKYIHWFVIKADFFLLCAVALETEGNQASRTIGNRNNRSW